MTWLGESKRAPVAAGSHRLSPRSTQPLRAACRKAGRGDVHRAGGVGDAAPVDQELVGPASEEPKEMVQDGVGSALSLAQPMGLPLSCSSAWDFTLYIFLLCPGECFFPLHDLILLRHGMWRGSNSSHLRKS